ncbi:MAG TPA: nif-specific transcriptional activator NifA [bacterium]|jgi:Nif-specific regulatory protein|nr:nif-specific transcriptional activator NifA [bacterium]
MPPDKETRKVSELSALYEVSKTLGSSLDVKATSQKAFLILHKLLGLNRGTLVLRDSDGAGYSIWAAYGLTDTEIERGRYQVGEGVTGKVLSTGLPVVVPDIGKEPLFLNRTKARSEIGKDQVAFLSVPVKVQGEILGALSVDRIFADEGTGHQGDIRFLTVLASLIGQAVKLSRSVEQGRQALVREKELLQSEVKGRYNLANVVGGSRKMQEVYATVERVAPTRSTVLIRGESGTGKELIARALHYNSTRTDKPFIRVSCAALPATLLESELFGHERGAFTGATDLRRGRFELADSGTLFLDEIGEIDLATQVKLLRVLQEKKFERLGGSRTLSVDVRLVAATNRDLEKAVADGTFREDLYYRLNVIPVFLPPLREREGDVLQLVEHFLQRFNMEHGKHTVFSRESLKRMLRYPWPGNVRELENALERLVVLAQGNSIEEDDLPLAIRSDLPVSSHTGSLQEHAPRPFTPGPREAAAPDPAPGRSLPETVRGIEKDRILRTLSDCQGIQTRAAQALGLTVRQLGYKLKKYGIKLRVPQAD